MGQGLTLTRLDWDSAHFGAEWYRVDGEGDARQHIAIVAEARDMGTPWLFRRMTNPRTAEVQVMEELGWRLADNMATLHWRNKNQPKPTHGGHFTLLGGLTHQWAGDLLYMEWPHSRFGDAAGEVYRAKLDKLVSEHGYRGLVYSRWGRNIGFTYWTPHEGQSELDFLVIDPKYRGRGIGKRLLSETMAQMWAEGHRVIETTTWLSDPAAMAVYQGLGFKVTANLMSYRLRL